MHRRVHREGKGSEINAENISHLNPCYQSREADMTMSFSISDMNLDLAFLAWLLGLMPSNAFAKAWSHRPQPGLATTTAAA